MKTTTLKRLECAWLLRDASWALKRYADRIERCCTENPNDENERKALVWFARAQERLIKFVKSRREYMLTNSKRSAKYKVYPIQMPDGSFGQRIIERNPWRAGWPRLSDIVRGGEIRIFIRGVILQGVMLFDSTGDLFGVNCDGLIFTSGDRIDSWRPA